MLARLASYQIIKFIMEPETPMEIVKILWSQLIFEYWLIKKMNPKYSRPEPRSFDQVFRDNDKSLGSVLSTLKSERDEMTKDLRAM